MNQELEVRVEDRPTLLEYAVYVTDRGRIAQVDGLSFVGDVPQLVQHRLEQPTEPIVIDLPAPIPELTPPSTSPASTTTMTSIPGTGA